ncbi:hypothetical protein GHT06_012676 [Daphnia sinensis]|uniref:Uncharacterized protein n=1 Tax=Daphnia sinensis TaxID=1820382 RepID=A0AAD5LFE4_9CRUS|nr:hypothetical protein GHT06_012676 [Daphnia sinensis]
MGHDRTTIQEKQKGVVLEKNRLTCVPLSNHYDKKRKIGEKRHVSPVRFGRSRFSYWASLRFFTIKNPDHSRNVSYFSLLPPSHRFGENNHLIIWQGLENLKSICAALDEFIAPFRRNSYPTALDRERKLVVAIAFSKYGDNGFKENKKYGNDNEFVRFLAPLTGNWATISYGHIAFGEFLNGTRKFRFSQFSKVT